MAYHYAICVYIADAISIIESVDSISRDGTDICVYYIADAISIIEL